MGRKKQFLKLMANGVTKNIRHKLHRCVAFLAASLDGGAVVEGVAAEVDEVDGDDVTEGDHGEGGEDQEAALVAPREAPAASAPPLIAVAVLDEVPPVRGADLGVGVRPGHFDCGDTWGTLLSTYWVRYYVKFTAISSKIGVTSLKRQISADIFAFLRFLAFAIA